MIIIRPNKPLPVLSANQHFPFAFLSTYRGNIASSMEAKGVRQPKHSLTRFAHPSHCSHRGLDVTPRATFWNVPATLRLPPSFCFLSPITHPNHVMPSFWLPLGRRVKFPQAFGSSVMPRLFLCVYTSPVNFCSLMPHVGLKSMVATSAFPEDFKGSCSLSLSLKFPFSLTVSQNYSSIFSSQRNHKFNCSWTAKLQKCSWICIL